MSLQTWLTVVHGPEDSTRFRSIAEQPGRYIQYTILLEKNAAPFEAGDLVSQWCGDELVLYDSPPPTSTAR